MALQQVLDPQADGGEQVVEIVGDAAGELTHRLHLVALSQLQLHRLVFGDVGHVDDHRAAGAREAQLGRVVGACADAHVEGTGEGVGRGARRRHEFAKARARRAAPDETVEGSVGVEHASLERELAVDQRDGERRGGQDVRRSGHAARTDAGRLLQVLEPHQEELRRRQADPSRPFPARKADPSLSFAVAPGGAEGPIELLTAKPGRAVRQVAPRAIRQHHPTGQVADGRRLRHGLQQRLG